MSKRKKSKSAAAENLIETLMGDLKEIQGESSYHEGHGSAAPKLESNLWDQLEAGMEKTLDESEFTGGAAAHTRGEYSSSEEDSVYRQGNEEEYLDSRTSAGMMPEGFGQVPELPPSEMIFQGSESDNEISVYKGPEIGEGQYQSPDDLLKEMQAESLYQKEEKVIDDATSAIDYQSPSGMLEDRTIALQGNNSSAVGNNNTASVNDNEKTIAVEGFANAKLGPRRQSSDVDVKVSIGGYRGGARSGAANVMTSVDATLAQAENLKIAQQRILDLEKEVEALRAENEELASAGEIVRSRTDDLSVRINSLEKEKQEAHESAQSEMLILKGNLQYKEAEVAKARMKVDELETRLKSDFKKIRVRERELENRLELLRAEKSALVRSKDEYILDQKRKIDQLSMELDNYRKKCLELNKALDANQDQFKRTERALRLALTNLEASEDKAVPFKKAE